jgi:hypothetical protein
MRSPAAVVARIAGRPPGGDDLIVPARTMGPIAASDAARMFKEDLRELGLRTSAGEFHDRGGHDLRAWFITSYQEQGAHRDLLRVVTHTAKGDIVSGYTRATWAALCAESASSRSQSSTESSWSLLQTLLQWSEHIGTAGQISWAL